MQVWAAVFQIVDDKSCLIVDDGDFTFLLQRLQCRFIIEIHIGKPTMEDGQQSSIVVNFREIKVGTVATAAVAIYGDTGTKTT
jgi:hypothetical protein